MLVKVLWCTIAFVIFAFVMVFRKMDKQHKMNRDYKKQSCIPRDY